MHTTKLICNMLTGLILMIIYIINRWFQGFDWEGLGTRTIVSPFKRKVLSPHDTSNFDKYPMELNLPPDESSGWDDDF